MEKGKQKIGLDYKCIRDHQFSISRSHVLIVNSYISTISTSQLQQFCNLNLFDMADDDDGMVLNFTSSVPLSGNKKRKGNDKRG